MLNSAISILQFAFLSLVPVRPELHPRLVGIGEVQLIAAAGPVGRSASADAGYKAGILTYSASKGAFIGASLNGAELSQDKKMTQDLYGSDVPFSDILQGKVQAKTTDARDFVNAVQNAKETAQTH